MHSRQRSAIAGVVAAVVALADPSEVVVGGSWGPELIGGIAAAVERMPRTVPLRVARAGRDAVLAGVRVSGVIACVVVFLAEMIASTDGLGHMLDRHRRAELAVDHEGGLLTNQHSTRGPAWRPVGHLVEEHHRPAVGDELRDGWIGAHGAGARSVTAKP